MIRHSGASKPDSRRIHDWSVEFRDAPNTAFFEKALTALREVEGSEQGYMSVGLVGHSDLPGVTLRRAQSVLRWDLRPSLWSHAFLVADRMHVGGDVRELRLREVPVYSRTGVFPEPADNAVADGQLGLYESRDRDPNVALLAIRLRAGEAHELTRRAIDDPNLDRPRYNLWNSLAAWSSYIWAADDQHNPLKNDVPVFSSAFVEYCYEAIRLDLAPGASERNSAPEHLWNSAMWWHEWFEELGRPITVFCCLRDPGCSVLAAGSTSVWGRPSADAPPR